MSCAYELLKQGSGRIVLFDKYNPASGTTGGSAGVICLHDLGEIYACLTLLGYARIKDLVRNYQLQFQPWGYLKIAYEPGPLPQPKDAFYQRYGAGTESIYRHEVLSREEVLQRFSWLRPEKVLGGVYYPNQGFIDPYGLVALYERLLLETGRFELQRHNPVLQIRTQGERIETLITRKGSWQVDVVTNAGGPWGNKIAHLAGCNIALTPQRVQVCVATGFEDGVIQFPLTGLPKPVEGEDVWCRGEMGGTLLFGQHHSQTKDGYTVDPDHFNRVNDHQYPEAVEGVIRNYWRLPKSVFLNGWCCVYGTTADGLPIVSKDTRLENFYHTVGMNGHGITCHAGIAQMAAELVLRRNTSLDMSSVLENGKRLDFSVLDVGRFG